MKKLGLIKRLGLTATTFVLCLAMLITCFTFTAPHSVHAEEPLNAKLSERITLAEDVNIKDSYDYGDTIRNIPEGATVIAPNGDTVTPTKGEVKATQLGIYKIRFEDKGVKYDFKVKVTLAQEYFLYIKYNGADIPTYVENNANSKFLIPEASVKYYDDDNVLQDYPGKDYDIEIKDSNNNSYKAGDYFDPTGKSGKVFITYSAKLGKASGTKLLTKTFTVNVQSKVNKSGNPSLAVSGITGDASVNRPVTLPVATVSDNNDDNVKVVIEVTYTDKETNKTTKVKKVEVNDDGYAVKTLDEDVEFDNDKSMTFYPTQTGKYKVTYTAYNDFYDEKNPSAGGKSSTTEAIIEVADHVAPVFKNTDSYEYLIPETWGVSVSNEKGKVADVGGKITFRVPEVVDNKCHMPVDKDDKDDLISIYFRITDSDSSDTVLVIQNILDTTGNDGKYTKGSYKYSEDASFENGEFVFDFSKYDKVNSKEEPVTNKAGTYTVLYRARDKDNNTSSKTYTITLKENYEDKDKPSSAEVTAPEYISVADEEFTIPYPVYADAEDIRPYVEYRLYSYVDGKDGAEGTLNHVDVKGGETAKIVEGNGETYVLINEDADDEKKLVVGSNLYYYVGVTDKVGNFRSNAIAADKSFIDLNKNPEDYEKIDAKTQIISSVNSGEIKYSDAKLLNTTDSNTVINAGDTVNLGTLVITAAGKDMRYYTGFEVAVYDPNGDYEEVSLVTLSDFDGTNTLIYIKDITFTASIPTEEEKPYVMTVRVFDVNGKNYVYGYTLDNVNPSSFNNAETSAISTIGSGGSVNVKYKLHNSVIKHIAGSSDDTFRVVRKISGGIFSIMGNEFTAKTACSYNVQDGYIKATDISEGDFDYSDKNIVKFSSANDGVYSFNVVDDAKPIIELQDIMPTYMKKDSEITIPKAIAYTENGMGEIETDVKDPDGNDVDLKDNKFTADKDGVYTVTYSATYENGEKDSVSYNINVGDVLAPRFTLEKGTSTSSVLQEGKEFTFKNIVLDADEDKNGVTITKEIYDPSHEIISGSTVSGGYSGYANNGNNGSKIYLTKVGEYTIVYTAKDSVGNEYKITETLTVTGKGSSSATTWTTLSTVLIIVAIVLLAGVIVYVVRFRKVKK